MAILQLFPLIFNLPYFGLEFSQADNKLNADLCAVHQHPKDCTLLRQEEYNSMPEISEFFLDGMHLGNSHTRYI